MLDSISVFKLTPEPENKKASKKATDAWLETRIVDCYVVRLPSYLPFEMIIDILDYSEHSK